MKNPRQFAGLLRKPEPMPEPELVEYGAHPNWDDQRMPGDDRIKAKIADVIKSRVRHSPSVQTAAHARDRVPELGADGPAILRQLKLSDAAIFSPPATAGSAFASTSAG